MPMEPPVPVYTHRIPPYCFKTAPSSPATTLLSCFSSSRAIYHLKLFPHHLFSQFSPQKHTTSHSKFLQEAGPDAKELCPSTSQLPAVSQPVLMGSTAPGQAHSHPKEGHTGAHNTLDSQPTAPGHRVYSSSLDLECSSYHSKADTDTGRTLLKPCRSKIRGWQLNPAAKKKLINIIQHTCCSSKLETTFLICSGLLRESRIPR